MPEWAWPFSNNWRIWCVSRFHVNKNIKQTYKSGLHFTVICCTNKWTLHSRTSKQVKHLWFAKLRIFFNRKKIRKIRILDLWLQPSQQHVSDMMTDVGLNHAVLVTSTLLFIAAAARAGGHSAGQPAADRWVDSEDCPVGR